MLPYMATQQGSAPPAQGQDEYVVVLTPSGYEVISASQMAYQQGGQSGTLAQGGAPIQTGFATREEAQAAADALANQRGGQSAQAPRYQIQQNIQSGRGDISGYEDIPAGLPGGAPAPVDWEQSLQNYRMTQRPNQEANQAALLAELQTPTASGNRRVFDYGSPGLGGTTMDPRTGTEIPTGGPGAPGSLQNPVDPYREGIFEGTWAEGRTTNPQLTNLIAGNMTPEAAVMNILDAAGQRGYGNRDILEQSYQDFGNIYTMSNPGSLGLDPAQYYGQAGDFVTGMLDRGDDLQFLDAPALWDNQYSDAYAQQVASLTQGQDNPGEIERDMILTNIAALSPYMGDQQTAYLATNVENEYNRYIAGGFNSEMSFVEYLRSIGADDWM